MADEEIEAEIFNPTYFSWQVDETTDINCHSQLSIIIRFVKQGKIIERFLGLYDTSSGRTLDDVFRLLTETFEKLNLKDKLIAPNLRWGFCYDFQKIFACTEMHVYSLQLSNTVKYCPSLACLTSLKVHEPPLMRTL